MGLSDKPVAAVVAVSDMERAKGFYEGKLGLSDGIDQDDGGRTYTCAGGTQFHIYPSPDNAGKSGATLAWWDVSDVGSTVDELSSNGVSFERYGEPFNTDDRGIAKFGELEAAWFKDPDGNVLAVGNNPRR
jgi:catechol 2,3-dioxygenase-like lactoylglutathione lyase family enzyme